MYTMPEWFVVQNDSSISRVRCFVANFMEPYMLVRYKRDTPVFHDQFVNYGYNKVQYFENLRQMGYSFYVISKVFAMDFPHPDSDFRISYNTMIRNKEENPMRIVYNELQMSFNMKYKDRRSSRVCFLRQPSYYEEV